MPSAEQLLYGKLCKNISVSKALLFRYLLDKLWNNFHNNWNRGNRIWWPIFWGCNSIHFSITHSLYSRLQFVLLSQKVVKPCSLILASVMNIILQTWSFDDEYKGKCYDAFAASVDPKIDTTGTIVVHQPNTTIQLPSETHTRVIFMVAFTKGVTVNYWIISLFIYHFDFHRYVTREWGITDKQFYHRIG